MKKFLVSIFQAMTIVAFVGLSACSSSSSSGTSSTSAATTVNVSGTLYDVNDAPVASATITSKNASDDSAVDTATTAADGSFTVAVPVSTEVYLSASKSGYVTSNSEIGSVTTAQTGVGLQIVDTGSADVLVPLVDGSTDWNQAKAKGWIALDFYYGTATSDSEDITATTTSSLTFKYHQCGDTYSASVSATPSPACVNRNGPMAIAYSTTEDNVSFDVTGSAVNPPASTVAGGTITVKLPLRIGEMAYTAVWTDGS